MTLDIKGVNSVLLIIIIVLVLYSLLRKELFTTSVAVPTTICSKKSNKNKAYHPSNSNNHEFNPENCMYVGENISSCKVDKVPLAANSGDEELYYSKKIDDLYNKSGTDMNSDTLTNICKLCSSTMDSCLTTGVNCDNIDDKLKKLYDSPKEQTKLKIKKNDYKRRISNFDKENNSMKNKYKYLVGACDSYCNMFNIQ